MELETTLTDISQKLRDGRFPNEQAISQGIVLRILNELNWEVYDTNIVWPEFATGDGRRVDFALCDPPSKPKCFVEVKQQGKAEDGIRQALEYAFHSGVPFVVLTDGQTWSFYLPAEQGNYEERRVFKLDLFERTNDEAAEILQRYLQRDRVVSGKSLDEARKEYRDKNRRSLARQAIPEAWRELVERGDDLLRELLVDAVESKVGIRPDNEDIVDFLARLVLLESKPVSSPSPGRRTTSGEVPAQSTQTTEDRSTPISPTNHTVTILGENRPYRNAKEAMILILSELAKKDSGLLKRCSQHKAFHGRERHYIAQRIEDLYPGRPDLQHEHERLPGNWFVGTNISNRQKMGLIKAATEVAGLIFGRDVVVTL